MLVLGRVKDLFVLLFTEASLLFRLRKEDNVDAVDDTKSWKDCIDHWSVGNCATSTLPETNIALENGWLEDCFPFGRTDFQRLCQLVSESVFGLENGGFPLPERGYRDPRGAGGAVAVVVAPVAKSTG